MKIRLRKQQTGHHVVISARNSGTRFGCMHVLSSRHQMKFLQSREDMPGARRRRLYEKLRNPFDAGSFFIKKFLYSWAPDFCIHLDRKLSRCYHNAKLGVKSLSVKGPKFFYSMCSLNPRNSHFHLEKPHQQTEDAIIIEYLHRVASPS